MTPLSIAAFILLWIVAIGTALAFAFRRQFISAWREPVLAAPVLIVESDDWGYGPPEQATTLRQIANALARHHDHNGHPPVMTLGVVLAGPDTDRIAADECRQYHRLSLAEPVRTAMIEGARQGVFALQLHGLEHFWPPVLLAAAVRDPVVRGWLSSHPFPATEALPTHLQSRWIDASTLPSGDLPAQSIDSAVELEVTSFSEACGRAPDVVVPPTFVWTPAVERAWSRAGLRVLVTPGRRYGSRDASGKPVQADAGLHNAQRSQSGLTYLVRDDYFEPALGHTAERALAALEAKNRFGRPTLLETHRTNFIGDPAKAERSLIELERLLAAALARWPRLRFMSSAELARHYLERTALIEQRLLPRVHCFLLRLAQVSRLRKLALASGIALPAALLWAATRHSRQAA